MIRITFTSTIPTVTPCVLAISDIKKMPAQIRSGDKKYLTSAIEQMHFTGKENTFCDIPHQNGKYVLAGITKNPSLLDFENLGGCLGQHTSQENEIVYIPTSKTISPVDEAVHVAYGLLLGSYRFSKYKTKQSTNRTKLKKVTFVVPNVAQAKNAFKAKQIIAESVYFARDLSSEPANTLTPKIFAEKIKSLEQYGLSVKILTHTELKQKKFGLLLSVAQGSENKPYVAILQWNGNKQCKTIDLGLVGKGVTFDSGGISLKPGAGMGDMKQDMTGAGVVVSTMMSIAKRKVKSNVVGVVGLVENMPSGSATRPGDIVTSLSGQTVEILNTDAEGRLVLGDCLWYLQQQYPVKKIIDLATLTGATMRALGEEYAGLFTNDDAFGTDLIKAADTCGEHIWKLPMNKAYDKMMDSAVADMKNIGGINAGGSTAACFLNRFIKPNVIWAHLDIAGVDKLEKSKPTCPKGATGWGVQLLNTYIK